MVDIVEEPLSAAAVTSRGRVYVNHAEILLQLISAVRRTVEMDGNDSLGKQLILLIPNFVEFFFHTHRNNLTVSEIIVCQKNPSSEKNAGA